MSLYICRLLNLNFTMSKIIFEINYNIFPEKREDYLNTIRDLKDSMSGHSETSYGIYEDKKKPNNFTEMYICGSEEELDALEDNQSEETVQLTQKLFDEFIKDKKVQYSTKYEI